MSIHNHWQYSSPIVREDKSWYSEPFVLGKSKIKHIKLVKLDLYKAIFPSFQGMCSSEKKKCTTKE